MTILDNSQIRNLDTIKNYSSTIVYGAGSHIEEVVSFLERNDISIECLCDADPQKHGRQYAGHLVLALDSALRKYKKGEVAVTLGITSWQYEVSNRLIRQYGIYPDDIFSYCTIWAQEYMYDYRAIFDNVDDIKKVYSFLSDKYSRILFENLINAKISRNPMYLIPNKCMKENYIYTTDELSIKPHGICIDAGAFTGDTAELFLSFAQVTKVICIEPLSGNYNEIIRRASKNNMSEKVHVIHSALGKEKGEIGIYTESNISVSASTNDFLNPNTGETVAVNSLDDLFLDRDSIDYIKFDIEGAEVDALYGGINMLRKFKPTLMVSAYHYTQHLWEIPLLIHNEFPEAKIYLGHQMNAPFEPEYYVLL